MGRSEFVSERSCCTVFCPGHWNLLGLPTNRMVCVRICFDRHLLAPYLSGGTLCNGHSRRCRDRSVHDVAGKHLPHPKAPDRLGAAIAVSYTHLTLPTSDLV